MQTNSPAKLTLKHDRALLAFVFARFIDGELTGIAEGRALTYAPTLAAADFLARQVRDEIRHARMYAALLRYVTPEKQVPQSPWLLKKIMAPISGRLWHEHCFLDKAVGERWVLYLMRTIMKNTNDRRINKTLEAIAKDEELHIRFGEEETHAVVKKSRFWRFYLWGLFLRVDFAMALAYRLLKRLIAQRYSKAAAALLANFFTHEREKVATEVAALLGVSVKRSVWQMVFCQVIFWLRWPLVGWLRAPRVSSL